MAKLPFYYSLISESDIRGIWQEITQGKKIRLRGFAPSLSDSEIITMEIVGEFKGIDTDKGIWNYFRGHWLNLFPQITHPFNFCQTRTGVRRLPFGKAKRSSVCKSMVLQTENTASVIEENWRFSRFNSSD